MFDERFKGLKVVCLLSVLLFGCMILVQPIDCTPELKFADSSFHESFLANPHSMVRTDYQSYQSEITTDHYNKFSTSNAVSPSISTYGYLAENIVYDSVTEKYWWIFTDIKGYPTNQTIRLAYSSDINGNWTVQSSPVIEEVGHYVQTPMLTKFGDFWYIYYGRSSNTSDFHTNSIYVQKSLYVNHGYNSEGIENPILDIGQLVEWDGLWVYEPYVILVGDTYLLFYAGFSSGIIRKTGYATSDSPTSGFVKCAGNPVLPAEGYPHDWDTGLTQAVDPFVFQIEQTYWIGVTASLSGNYPPWLIGFYYTHDFVTFHHYMQNSILSPSGLGKWDGNGVLRGAVSKFDGIYYLAYTGDAYYNNFKMGKTVLAVLPNTGIVITRGCGGGGRYLLI